MAVYQERFVDGAVARGVDARRRRARLRAGARLLGVRLPEGARGRVRAARLPVDVAARALRAGVPVRAAERAADGLLSAGRAGARGAAARDRGPAAARQPERGRVPGREPERRPDRARLRARRAPSRRSQALVAERERGGAFARCGRPRGALGRRARHARAPRVGGRVRRAGWAAPPRGAVALGVVDSRAGRCGAACSWRCRSRRRRRPRCAS